MKKEYSKPEIEIIFTNNVDVLTASQVFGDSYDFDTEFEFSSFDY